MKRALCLTAFALGAGALLHAETELCVNVRDNAGLAVAGARVAITPQAASAVIRGVTNAEGRMCEQLPVGVYVLRAERDHMLGAAATVTLSSRQRAQEQTMTLSVAPTATQIEVTASRLPASLMEAPAPVTQLDRKRMEALGARGLNDVLQEQPEVVTYAGGAHANGGSANIQGYTSRNVEILIDGEPLVGRVAGYLDLNQLDSSIVDAVEIKTGASAMTYGLQGQGGAINIITRRAQNGFHGSVESGYGSFNTAQERAEGGVAARGWAAFGAASVQRNLGYDTDSTTAVKTQPAGNTKNYFSSIYAPRVGALTSGLTAMWMEQGYWGFDSGTTGVYDFERPRRRFALLPRASIALNGENLLSFRARHLYYRSAEELFYRTPGTFSHTATVQQADGGDADWSLVKANSFRAFVGVSGNRETIKGTSLGTADGNAERTNFSQIGSAEYTIGGRLKLQSGYRADHDSIFGNKVSPQWMAAYRIAPGLSLSASVTRGFRAPDFSELYLNNTHAGGRVRVLGNTALRPEQSWSGSTGLLYVPGRRVRLEARAFENRMEEMIQATFTGREGIASVYRYLNVGAARIRGAMTNAEVSVSRQLRLNAGYQYLHSRDAALGKPLEYSPVHRATFGAIYANATHGILASFFGNTSSRTYLSTSGGVDSYMRQFELFGINVQKDLTRNLALRVAFRNLSSNIDPSNRITAPFSVESSLRYQFGSAR